jgi:hypothetical protein
MTDTHPNSFFSFLLHPLSKLLTFCPNTTYSTPAVSKKAKTPIPTPSPTDAAALKPDDGDDGEGVASICNDTEDDDDAGFTL